MVVGWRKCGPRQTSTGGHWKSLSAPHVFHGESVHQKASSQSLLQSWNCWVPVDSNVAFFWPYEALSRIPCSLQASISSMVFIAFRKCCSIKPDDLYKTPSGWEFPTKIKKGSREVTSPQLPLSDPQLANAGAGKAATSALGPAGASWSGASNALILSKPFPGYHQKNIFSISSSK